MLTKEYFAVSSQTLVVSDLGPIIGSRPSDHYFRSVCLSVCLFVCLFVCLCRVFLSRLWSHVDQTRTRVICLGLVVSPRILGLCDPWGLGDPLKTCIFRGLGAQKTTSSYSFDRIVLILVILYNAPIHFFAISILNPNYDVINDVISGFAKVVVERCGFHCCIAQTISWGEVVSVFLYLL